MRTLYPLALVYIGLFLSGCASQSTTTDTPPTALLKDPTAVAIYTRPSVAHKAYQVVGTATLSQYNKAGIKRQLANVHDGLRTIAAHIGGDAIIDILEKNHIVTGTVIAYQDSVKHTPLNPQYQHS